MPTARSSTEAATSEAGRAAVDLGTLLRFRLAGLRGRSRRAAPIALAVLSVLTVAAAAVPAFLEEGGLTRAEVARLLPSVFLSVLVISVASAATTGGGRELLPHDQAVAFPVSPTTDHLGALTMAPLNIAWLLQGWTALSATAYVVGAGPRLLPAALTVLLWLVTATTVAQAVAWALEWVRRGARGPLVVRTLGLVAAVGVGVLVATGSLVPVLDRSPTRPLAAAVIAGTAGRWLAVVVVLLVLVAVALLTGAALAELVSRRPARDELRGETARRPTRPHPGSDLAALMRTDRAGIWRSVPLRRGLVVLALLPGLVAVGGSFTWDMLGVFPGLVASGGALLFGVNSWCLDGLGARWRDSLPVAPRLVFASRVLVLSEILLFACVATVLISALRAGLPTTSQLVAVVCASVVVTLQVVATSLRWSVRSPYAVNLRSARATPAPPLVMVGYSARLAVSTTFTGLLFNTAGAGPWTWPLLLSVPFLLWSGVKLLRTAGAWADPETRSRVVAAVAS